MINWDWIYFFRELREHIRKELDASLRANTNPEVNEAYLNKQYDALNRILNNVYGNKYKRCNYTETASGLTLELCQFATSKENIDNKRD